MDANKTDVILMCGVPGSGKSTVSKELQSVLGAYNCVIVSTDAIREELLGSEADQSNQALIWNTAYDRAATAVREGKKVIFDATMTRRKDRTNFLKEIKSRVPQATVALCYVKVPLFTALVRNANRERKVPTEVIERMNQNLLLTPPQKEGFEDFFTVEN